MLRFFPDALLFMYLWVESCLLSFVVYLSIPNINTKTQCSPRVRLPQPCPLKEILIRAFSLLAGSSNMIQSTRRGSMWTLGQPLR